MQTIRKMDRLAMRCRPPGAPFMHQNWNNLLFMHWPVEINVLRPLIPRALEIDTFEERAWIGITPFEVTGLRFKSLPPLPGLDSFLELNARTYVHSKGVPGVWFFSLDASKLIPVMGARVLFSLPYFKSEITFSQDAQQFRFACKRLDTSSADFHALWRPGIRLRDPDCESLAFFLVERYCLFAEKEGRISQTRIYHHPWILNEAAVSSWGSTMLTALGLPEPATEPITHFSRSLCVEIWPPREAGGSTAQSR
jgi:uncharacterized protein